MTAGATYVPIQSVTITTSSTIITLGSGGTIPQSYTDLRLIINASMVSGSSYISYRANGDSGTNYSYTRLFGNGSSAISGRNTNKSQGAIDPQPTSTNLWTCVVDFMNYSNSTTYKTVLSRPNDTSNSWVGVTVNLWRSTAAITSISIIDETGNSFNTGSTFTLYGIAAA